MTIILDKMYESLYDDLRKYNLWNRVKSETLIIIDQFRLMPGRSNIQPIFYAKEKAEIYRKRKIKVCMIYTNLEKAYGNVSREVMKQAIMNKDHQKLYVIVIEEMCKWESARQSLRGEIDDFKVRDFEVQI